MPKNPEILNNINLLRQRYYESAGSKESLLDLIAQAEVSEQVYNSNAIENSTLNLEETEKILLQIDLDRFISQREIFEAKNLSRVIDYINKTAKEKELNLEVILLLHKMLISNIHDKIAGRFRQENEFVRVGSHIAPAPKDVVKLLEQMLITYNSNPQQNISRRVARLHLDFENIHPFVDGNGRIGRILNNYLLIREGYVPINIKFLDRPKYYAAFKEFDTKNDCKIMTEIIGKALTNSYHKRLAYLEEKEIITLAEFAKQKKVSHSNLLNKANRQTIEAFSERGIWKIAV
jgi:Fic family protein